MLSCCHCVFSSLHSPRMSHNIGTMPLWLFTAKQTSVNQGLNSRFVLKAIMKALISKSSQSAIMKNPNHVHPIHEYLT